MNLLLVHAFFIPLCYFQTHSLCRLTHRFTHTHLAYAPVQPFTHVRIDETHHSYSHVCFIHSFSRIHTITLFIHFSYLYPPPSFLHPLAPLTYSYIPLIHTQVNSRARQFVEQRKTCQHRSEIQHCLACESIRIYQGEIKRRKSDARVWWYPRNLYP